MKQLLIGFMVLVSSSSFSDNETDGITIAQRAQHVIIIASKMTNSIEKVEELSSEQVDIIGRGAICFKIGTAFASLKVLETITEDIENGMRHEIYNLTERTSILGEKYCKHLSEKPQQ